MFYTNFKLSLSYLLIILIFNTKLAYTQDSLFLKVHFLYGSKPAKQHKNTEEKWFGGELGGHVGIESDSNKILNFLPKGNFHTFEKENLNSQFAIHSFESFYTILRGNLNTNKRAIVYIPITKKQKHIFDSISCTYLKQTPYDYALFGMRCGSSTYEILSQLKVLPNYSLSKTAKKNFILNYYVKNYLKKQKETNG